MKHLEEIHPIARNWAGLSVSAILLLLSLVGHAESQGCPGADGAARIGNDAIAATLSADRKHLQAIGICAGLTEKKSVTMPDAFLLHMKDGSAIKASAFTIEDAPVTSRIVASAEDPRREGEQLCTTLLNARAGLRAKWCLVLPQDAHYIRQTLELTATASDSPIATVQLLALPKVDAHRVGAVSGSPAVAGDWYFGFEHPLSTITNVQGVLRASIQRSLPLRAGNTVMYSSVIGVVSHGQMRRDFQAYLERERPRPYATFLHYNSWYDLGYTNRFDEAGALDRIHTFGTELTTKRAVKLDSFLFDDGWDDPHTLWGFDKGFPHGFTSSSEAAARFDANIGVWLSPWGGYEEQKKQRIANGRANGYEIVDDGFALSGPRYFQAFEARCLEMIDTYHVNQFKFDGTGNANHVFPGSLFDSDFEAAIALITRLRKQEPQLFVNLTTGTFPSPFWLKYADSIWRGGEDHSFAGVGTWREKWITYRDAQTYKHVVQAGPLFPLNSLMLHGLIWARYAEHLETDPGKDFSKEVWSYFGSGTQLQEMYITPSSLHEEDWDTLAKAARWSRANQAILRDSHWLGGDPGKLQIYGWASWSAAKSIIVLRNPSATQQIFSLHLAQALELPHSASMTYDATQIFGSTPQPLRLRADISRQMPLQPFEVRVIELLPVQ